jgi:hypothetical protein
MPQNRLVQGVTLVVAAAATSLMASAPARAQGQEAPPPPEVSAPAPAAAAPAASAFGAQGAWVFTYQTADSGTGFFLFRKTSGGGSTITLNPGVDYFLAPSISVGGNITFSHVSGSSDTFGAGIRAGYNIALLPNASFWPMARFFLTRLADPQHTVVTSFGVLAPFLWHLTPHFFLGAGPHLTVQLSGGTDTEYGIDFMLGGWI